ncbi:MAG TPA: peptidase M28 [Verrucomicrobiales bacterium]|nr:peptidase M28 [Verrucomicrobiales bacterium]
MRSLLTNRQRIEKLLPRFLALGLALAPAATRGADPSAGEGQFLSRTRQLLFEGRRSGEGYFSPDGRALTFQSERDPANPFYQIYLLDLESGDTRRISPGVGKTTCSFFRPGTDEVIFASTHLDPEAAAKQKAELEFRASGKTRRYSWDYDSHMDIFSVRRDGTGLRRLTDAEGYDAEGALSPDGRLIVFCSLRDAYPASKLSPEDRKRLETDPSWFGEIYLMNADGSNQRRLTRKPGYDGGPFFSPDGKRILWRRFDETGVNADIYTMDLEGGDVRRLTDFGCMSWAPYFHPSGRYVVFTANKLGFENFELFIASAEGDREPVRVTHTDGFDGLPVFSPDGRKLSWTSNRTPDAQSQIFLADWNHEAALAALESSPPRIPGGAKPDALPGSRAGAAAAAVRPPSSGPAAGGLSADITEQDLRSHVGYLASDELEGRKTGTPGAALAAGYIRTRLTEAGLRPLSADGFDQPFEFTASTEVVARDNTLVLTRSNTPALPFVLDRDFRPLGFTTTGKVEGEVVFAGYGLVVPGKGSEGYDSYAGVNVSNKVVLVLRYVPEGVEPKRRQELNRYAGLRYKAMMARERGARALLVVTGPNSPNAGELIPISTDGSFSGSGIPAACVGTNLVEALFAATGKDLKGLQSGLDNEAPHAEGSFAFPATRIALSTGVRQIKQTDRNVIGLLPPSPGVREYVMIGAHYDHLGRGDGNSLHHKGEENLIHSGADDNASGVSAVLEIAAALGTSDRITTRLPAHRGLIVALWSGEEIGLLGSYHYAEHPLVPLTNVAAYINFDMVGRLRENKLTLQGTGSSTTWRRLAEKRNVAAGFSLSLQEDPYLPTDVTALYPKGVPVLNFFTGSHDDYHRPTDKAGTLNYEGLERITRFAAGFVDDLLKPTEAVDYVKVTTSGGGSGGRETLRAFLGTIPDYGTEVAGVKLSGVRGGSPADKSGLKGGDIIIQFAGQKIANIYDYTYALDAVRIGKPVEIVVTRGPEKLTLTVIPEARK